MSPITKTFTRLVRRGGGPEDAASQNGAVPELVASPLPDEAAIEIAPNDPIVGYFQSATGPVALSSLELDSPALQQLRQAGVELVAPLVSQGELVGVLNLGPRLSGQEYSSDDRKLLDSLAAQAAPALQVAQLVRRQEAEARSRERIEQELRVATLIQQNFLPKHLPDIAGWTVAAHYAPAREVGGDFYDFLDLPDGLGIVIGDVTDKGVPAAMVMAATRSVLRASAQRIVSPGEVLRRVNDLMCPDMPPKMFVTCCYGVLDTDTGQFRFANAGHNLPYVRTATGTIELRATGMPLGLIPDADYEEAEAWLEPGQTMLLHSDGVAEAHGEGREMFGFPRLMDVVGARSGSADVIERVLAELDRFTPDGWEQEDDITLVAVTREDGSAVPEPATPAVDESFSVPSVEGSERRVAERVIEIIAPLGLDPARLDKLKTATAEAAMNAIEHGNQSNAELLVGVAVRSGGGELSVRITDRGGDSPVAEAEAPDIELKLEGLQKPRGWGLFLIQNMVDDIRVETEGSDHTIELIMKLDQPEVGK